MISVAVPDDLRGSFARYCEIWDEEQEFFWPTGRRYLFVALPLSVVFMTWIAPLIRINYGLLLSISVFAAPWLATIDIKKRKKKLKLERDRIAPGFARRGLEISYTPGLGGSVKKGERAALLKLIINT